MCMHINMYQLPFLTWHDCKRNSHSDFSHPHEYRKKEFKGCLNLCIHCEIPEYWKVHFVEEIRVLCNLLCEGFQLQCYCTWYNTSHWVGVHLASLWPEVCGVLLCASATLHDGIRSISLLLHKSQLVLSNPEKSMKELLAFNRQECDCFLLILIVLLWAIDLWGSEKCDMQNMEV